MEKVEFNNLNGEQKEKMIPFTVIIGLIVLFLIFCMTCLSLTFKHKYTLHYSDSSNLDYKVYLNESSWDLYQGKKYLGKGLNYVASTIDYVDADFYYTFKSDDNLDLQYSYYITAKVDIENADGGDFGTDYTDTLLESTSYNADDDNTFRVSENVQIDYAKYNAIANNFIRSTGVTAEANLIVSLYVDVIGTHADFDRSVADKAAVTLTIPLANNTMQFSMDYDLTNNADETLQYRSTIINIPVLFYFCIVLAFVDIAAMALIIAWIILNRDENTLYKKKLNRILRDYDKYISETMITEKVEDLMKTKSLRIVVIKSFDGLIDVRDNLNVPILYHEEVPGKEAVFYIINDRIGYIYVMKAEDLKKNKKEVKAELKTTKKTPKKSTKKEELIAEDVVVEKLDNIPKVEPLEEKVDVEELNEDLVQALTEDDIRVMQEALNSSDKVIVKSEKEVERPEENFEIEETVEDTKPVIPEIKVKSAKAKAREKNQRYYRRRK